MPNMKARSSTRYFASLNQSCRARRFSESQPSKWPGSLEIRPATAHLEVTAVNQQPETGRFILH